MSPWGGCRPRLQGGADSRQEIRAALSLEDLQARRNKMLQSVEVASAADKRNLDIVQQDRDGTALRRGALFHA